MKINYDKKTKKNILIVGGLIIFYVYSQISSNNFKSSNVIVIIGILAVVWYWSVRRKTSAPENAEPSWPVVTELQKTKMDCLSPIQEERVRDIYREMCIADLFKNKKGDVKSQKKSRMKK